MNFTQEQISDIVVKPVVAYNEMKAIMSLCQFDCSSLRLRYFFVQTSVKQSIEFLIFPTNCQGSSIPINPLLNVQKY